MLVMGFICLDAGKVLFGASRLTSAPRSSKVAYTVPAWRPYGTSHGSPVGASDVVAILRRARYIQNFKKVQEWDRDKERLDGPTPVAYVHNYKCLQLPLRLLRLGLKTQVRPFHHSICRTHRWFRVTCEHATRFRVTRKQDKRN